MRQVGLDGEGMYSVENLLQILRNNGHQKLSKIRENAYDFMHSIGETAITLTITNNLEEKKKKKRKNKLLKKSSFKGWIQRKNPLGSWRMVV